MATANAHTPAEVLPTLPVRSGDRWLDAEFAKERRALALHKAKQASGVRWAGMSEDRPFNARTIRQMVEDAETARKAHEAFASSVRGRFLAALNELEQISYAVEADAARSAYYRGFAATDRPASPGEIGNALLALNPIAGNDAREARACLAEMLLETNRRAAA